MKILFYLIALATCLSLSANDGSKTNQGQEKKHPSIEKKESFKPSDGSRKNGRNRPRKPKHEHKPRPNQQQGK